MTRHPLPIGPGPDAATEAGRPGTSWEAGRDGPDGLLRLTEEEAGGLLGDGVVRHLIADVHTARATPDCAVLRARAARLALEPVLRRRRAVAACWVEPVVGHLTAAWILAGGPAPHRIDMISAPGRARWRDPLLRTHEHRLGAGDLQDVAGLYVTGPVRTAADLARSLPSTQSLPWLGLLAQECGLRPLQVLDQLAAMAHGRGVRNARQVVQWWAALAAERGAA